MSTTYRKKVTGEMETWRTVNKEKRKKRGRSRKMGHAVAVESMKRFYEMFQCNMKIKLKEGDRKINMKFVMEDWQ